MRACIYILHGRRVILRYKVSLMCLVRCIYRVQNYALYVYCFTTVLSEIEWEHIVGDKGLLNMMSVHLLHPTQKINPL